MAAVTGKAALVRVRVVENGLDGLVRDVEALPAKAGRAFAATVRSNINEGNRLAKSYARAKAGPHGKAYYKRLSAEMTGPFSGEYGPEGDPKTNFVGVGFRHGVNLDLPNSADVVGPKFAEGIDRDVDRLFW